MARGQPDFGMYAQKRVAASMSDMGEAAVRLGSIVTYDRRGDVILLDDFSDGVSSWERLVVGAGAQITDVNSYAKTGFTTMRLTTGNLIGNNVTAARRLAYPILSSMGFECAFMLEDDLAEIRWHLSVSLPPIAYFVYIKYRPPTQDLQYRAEDGLWYTFADGIDLTWVPALFHIIKLVGDFVNLPYTKCMLNENTYDLSAHALYHEASVGVSQMGVQIYTETAVNDSISAYIDDVIVTQEEPLGG